MTARAAGVIVHAPGAKVMLHGEIECVVTTISIRGEPHNVVALYEVTWLNDGCRQEAWAWAFELSSVSNGSTVPVGFK